MPDTDTIGKQPGAQPSEGPPEPKGRNGYRNRMAEVRAEHRRMIDDGTIKVKRAASAPPPMRKWPEPFKGHMSELAQACQGAAKRKQGDIATLGMLIAMASCIPGVYRMEGDGLRCNLYGLGTADTSQGKDVIKRMSSLIATMAGSIMIGAPGSGGGFQDSLASWWPVLSLIDEIHDYLASGNNRKASPHLAATIALLLDLYTASQSLLPVRALTTDKKKRNTGNVLPPLHHPMFSLLGFSTPVKLRKALTVENVTEGLLGRVLVAVGVDNSEEPLDFNTTGLKVPEGCAEVIRHLAVKRVTAAACMKVEEVQCIDVLMGDGVRERLEQMDKEDVERRKAMPKGSLARALNMRAVERVTRIAMVLAIWANPGEPVISVAMLDWAHEAALASDSHMVELIGEEGRNLATDDAERADAGVVLRAIQSYIKRTGEEWCDRSSLMDNTFGKKKLDPALAYLIETGRIEEEERSEFNPKANRNYQKKYYRAVQE